MMTNPQAYVGFLEEARKVISTELCVSFYPEMNAFIRERQQHCVDLYHLPGRAGKAVWMLLRLSCCVQLFVLSQNRMYPPKKKRNEKKERKNVPN